MTSGRITPARICVAPLIGRLSPSSDRSRRKVRPPSGSPEAFRQDQRQPDLLVAGDRHADVVAQELDQVLVHDRADHDFPDAQLDGPPERRAADVGAADDHLPAMSGRQLASVSGRRDPRPPSAASPPLAAHAENALHQRGPRLHHHALAGRHLGDRPADVGATSSGWPAPGC